MKDIANQEVFVRLVRENKMGNYEFYVITKTPDLLEDGNMAHEWMYDGWDFSNGCKIPVIGMSDKAKPLGDCKVPVFEKGEIVICDVGNGREVGYPGRKPSKWDVEYDIFDNLDDAVKRSQELI